MTQNLVNNKNNKNNKNHKYTFIEVCSGAGGLSQGLIQAGWIPILLNDNNKDCCRTLEKNHPNAKIVLGSMEKVDFTPYKNKVDLLCGGVPCQSFSQAGTRKGLSDPRGGLMFKFIDIVNHIQPKIFMVENVKGLINHDKGKTLEKIINEFNKNNLYDIQYKCLNASNFNVPQKRERIFIIGVLKSLGKKYDYPKESKNKIILKNILKNVPPSPCAKYSDYKIKLFKMIPQGGCWVDLPDKLQKEYLGKSYYSGGGKRGILRRLSMNEPSLTLLCSPTQKQTERCHPTEERPLSIREYARIQTFDDNYQFVGSISSQYKQIGNAVPVELARQIGISLHKALQ